MMPPEDPVDRLLERLRAGTDALTPAPDAVARARRRMEDVAGGWGALCWAARRIAVAAAVAAVVGVLAYQQARRAEAELILVTGAAEGQP